MSFSRHIWRYMCLTLLVSTLLCLSLSMTITFVSVNQRARKLRESELNDAAEFVRQAFITASHQLRDLSNDSTLYYFYNRYQDVLLGKSSDTDAYIDLKNYLLNIIQNQDTFQYLAMDMENSLIIRSKILLGWGSRSSVRSYIYSGSEKPPILSIIRSQVNCPSLSSSQLLSVYTGDAFSLHGVIDLEAIFKDALQNYVVFDDGNNLLFNGLQNIPAREISAFLSSEESQFQFAGQRYLVNACVADRVHVAQFYPNADAPFSPSSLCILAAVSIGAMLLAFLLLFVVRKQMNALILQLKPIPSDDLTEHIADALHRRRQAQSMSAWLSSMLMRACTFPMVLIFLTNALLCVGHLKKQSERFAYQRVSQQAEFVNRQYQRCKDFLWNFSMDYLIQEYMREGVYDKIVTFFQEYSATLWNKCSERDLLSSISIYDAEWNNIYETGSIAIPLTNEAQRHFRQNFNSIYTVRGDNHVFCYFAIRNTHETSESSHLLQKLGYVAIAVADPVDTLSHSLPDARFLEEGASFPTAHGVVFPIDFPSLDLRLTVYIPTQSDLMDNISPIWLSFIAIILALLCLQLPIIHAGTKRILDSLNILQDDLEEIRHTPVRSLVPYGQKTGIIEIDLLSDYVHSLIVSLDKKQEDLKNRELELLREQKARVDLQLMAIESQLSPHFLFNIFTSIRFLLEEHNTSDAIEMFKRTVRMFRATLYRGNPMTTLESELEHVLAYMHVQSLRYVNQLTLQIEPFEESILHCFSPQYVLQPLVENAIEHALPGRSSLTVTLRAEKSQGDLHLYVSDNGGKIDEAQLQKIAVLLNSQDFQSHCGLASIHRRLQLHFGQNYGLKLSINSNRGLTVEVFIPALDKCPDNERR